MNRIKITRALLRFTTALCVKVKYLHLDTVQAMVDAKSLASYRAEVLAERTADLADKAEEDYNIALAAYKAEVEFIEETTGPINESFPA